ncbi:MAG: hypothetical protein QM754_06850 [Tepidisphaeraceae bacterium]
MNKFTQTSKLVRRYFAAQAKTLSAAAEAAVCEHPGLIGGHRESLNRIYLSKLIPKRFEIDRGMIYGPFSRSRECDVIIWDSNNYPSLPLTDHKMIFADSVRLVMEVKSTWNKQEFSDVIDKCRVLQHMSIYKIGTSLADEIDLMRDQLYALSNGIQHVGTLQVPAGIATSAIFFSGGKTFTEPLEEHDLNEVHANWPDICLLLGAGLVVLKEVTSDPETNLGGRGILKFMEFGDDALLVFTQLSSLASHGAVRTSRSTF